MTIKHGGLSPPSHLLRLVISEVCSSTSLLAFTRTNLILVLIYYIELIFILALVPSVQSSPQCSTIILDAIASVLHKYKGERIEQYRGNAKEWDLFLRSLLSI